MFYNNVPMSSTLIKDSWGPKMNSCGTSHVMSRGVDSTFMKYRYGCLFVM